MSKSNNYFNYDRQPIYDNNVKLETGKKELEKEIQKNKNEINRLNNQLS